MAILIFSPTQPASALLDKLTTIDKTLCVWINQNNHPWADKIVYWLTYTPYNIPFYMVLGYCILTKIKNKPWLVFLCLLILLIVCDHFASSLVKPWIKRLRPCLEPTLQAHIKVVGNYHGAYGFISSHAANTFGIAVFLRRILKPYFGYSWLLYGWALVVSYARIYGGVHYPADVFLGAVSGVIWGHAIYGLYAHINHKILPAL